jgi:hypothetical protein
MRRAILTGAIFVSAIGVVLATGITAASAQTNPQNVCIPSSNGIATQCLNDYNGNLTAGAQAVKFFHYNNSAGQNRIDVLFAGTIERPNGWQPFSDGSNLNTTYNGDNVYKFEWANGSPSGICIAGYTYNAPAFNESCNITNDQNQLWFVLTKFGALVSVGSSNARYLLTGAPNSPVWLGSNGKGNIGNGDPVYLTATQANNLPWGFFVDGG